MPFFRYTATDNSGKSLAGTISARRAEEAARVLQERGYSGVQVIDARSQGNYIRTKSLRDRDLSTFFAQLASLIRAGINPFEAFQNVAGSSRSVVMRKVADDMASGAREGGMLSDVMARYIDIFPHNAVAAVRAGEHGGFLPESLERLARHFAESASFKQWFYIVRLATWNLFWILVFLLPFMPAIWEAFREGKHPVVTYLVYLLRYSVPAVAIALVIYALLMMITRTHAWTMRRHRLVLKLPYSFGKRAMRESLNEFLWTLRNLTHAGVSFGTSWQLASGSAPNAYIATKLSNAGTVIGSERPLSHALAQSELFPGDYATMLMTGERTGDVVGMLDQIANETEEQYMAAKQAARFGITRIAILVVIVALGAFGYYIVTQYYVRMFHEVDRWIENWIL